MDSLTNKIINIPLIPLRELVPFPSTIIPILVGRERSINAINHSKTNYDSYLFLSVQKNQITDNPKPEEINRVGIIAKIEKSIEQKNGSHRVIIHGIKRGRVLSYTENNEYFLARIQPLEEKYENMKKDHMLDLDLIKLFEEYLSYKKFRIQGIIDKLETNHLSEITNIISSIISVPLALKQSLLEETDVYQRGIKLLNILKKEVFKMTSISSQRQKGTEEPPESDIEEYRRKINNAGFPENIKNSAVKELERFEMMPPYSAESTVSRTYLDWLLMIPWNKEKDDTVDIKAASKILDEDHFGLEKVKDRILDYLAVKQIKKNPVGEILCFIGPPGVGKSSLSKSIARALNRPFVRISLGGVKDEAEIRGHRRTYIGSYPGQIVKGLKKAKYMNPVFLLDEIDKLSSDFRGDPASALLEVLDPDQNAEFVDHYLDLEVDLSKVFFITTANTSENISPALKDRMEIIEISGYTRMEKLQIAKNFLLKKQAEKNGIKSNEFKIDDKIIAGIINGYTRESGVRNLERQIGMILRKIARNFVENGRSDNNNEKFHLTPELIQKFLGVPKYSDLKILKKSEVGVAVGMAWTPFGGDLLIIESGFIKGKGEMILTGRLGEVMKESSAAALSYTKLKLYDMEFDIDSLEEYNIHLHIPQGAVPKEGPSAGVTLAVALISLLTGIKVKANFAITGEITLRGKILPVGGIKEKIIAAHRYGVKNVIIPTDNERDYIEDIPEEIKNNMNVHFADNMDVLLEKVLEQPIKIKNVKSKVIKPFLSSNIQ